MSHYLRDLQNAVNSVVDPATQYPPPPPQNHNQNRTRQEDSSADINSDNNINALKDLLSLVGAKIPSPAEPTDRQPRGAPPRYQPPSNGERGQNRDPGMNQRRESNSDPARDRSRDPRSQPTQPVHRQSQPGPVSTTNTNNGSRINEPAHSMSSDYHSDSSGDDSPVAPRNNTTKVFNNNNNNSNNNTTANNNNNTANNSSGKKSNSINASTSINTSANISNKNPPITQAGKDRHAQSPSPAPVLQPAPQPQSQPAPPHSRPSAAAKPTKDFHSNSTIGKNEAGSGAGDASSTTTTTTTSTVNQKRIREPVPPAREPTLPSRDIGPSPPVSDDKRRKIGGPEANKESVQEGTQSRLLVDDDGSEECRFFLSDRQQFLDSLVETCIGLHRAAFLIGGKLPAVLSPATPACASLLDVERSIYHRSVNRAQYLGHAVETVRRIKERNNMYVVLQNLIR